MSEIQKLPIADLKAMIDFAEQQIMEHSKESNAVGVIYWNKVYNECRVQIHYRALELFGKPGQ